MSMKKKGIYKGAVAFMALCMSCGSIMPLSSTYVQAQENVAENEQNGIVSLSQNENQYTFGNEYITRTFSLTNGKLKTEKITNYRTGQTPKVLTPASSEEFVIKTLPKEIEGKSKVNVNDVVGTGEGKISNLTDQVLSSDVPSNFWASKDANNYVDGSELSIEIAIGSKEEVKKFKYVPRFDNSARWNCTGRVEEAQLFYFDDESNSWKQIGSTYKMNAEGETVIEFEKPISTSKIKFVATKTYHWQNGTNGQPDNRNKVMSASEIDLLGDENNSLLDRTRKEEAQILKSSDLEVDGEPTLTESNGVKILTFAFKPKEVSGVDYTIKEVITFKDGDSFMRKHLEISVPEAEANNVKIDYIDLENMDFAEEDASVNGKLGDKTQNYWTIPELKDNPDMANMKGDYLELGQPYYVGAMYWGCEFPQSENKIRLNNQTNKQNGFIRYHYGKSLAIDTQFTEYNNYNGANGQAGKMVTWDSVVGAARSTDYLVVQSDFYEYIETIATPTEFRQQFNSWYDNMKNITAENIKSSFFEVEKGFTQHGVNPLDSYVVDDGWINYNSFWDFDRNPSKFPNELYDSSLQVQQFGSNFGLWLGPRGGYGTQTTIANWIQNAGLGSVNHQSGNDINISDSRYLNKLVTDIFLGYQQKFDINYWKLDGMLLNPATAETPYHVTGNPFYTISETYERWTDMFEDMRAQRGDKGLWLNMTSYANPSPWHVQWVNSVWMQNTGDSGFDYKFNSTDQEAMLTYRDGDYYDFFNENQWQLPNKYFYNHDPVYAKTANSAPGGKPNYLINYSDEELREHLYMLGTRGTAFWEYYYSPSMFDDDKWDINAEAANWIEDNFDILQKSKMFGGNPETGDVYGYSCWNGNEGIVSIRNPKDVEQTYTLTYDRLVGVNEGMKDVYGKVVIGDVDKYQTNKPLSYGNQITFTLKPKEVLIMQYGEKDTTSATVNSIHGDNKVVEVEFNETIRTPKVEDFKVTNNKVEKVVLKEDLRTVALTLQKEVDDLSDIEVKVNGVKDVTGNTTSLSVVDDYYKDDIVNSIVNRKLDGKEIHKGKTLSIDGTGGFTVLGTIETVSKGAEIMRQENGYSVGIDAEGYLTFTMNETTANSKYVKKTRQEDGSVTSETRGMIADGKKHQFAVVKEVNGMLKLYIDGELVGSAYNKANEDFKLEKGELVFAKGLEGKTSYITVLDRALAFNEVTNYVDEKDISGNVAARSLNKDVKVSAFDVTENKAVAEKGDRPFAHINDGNKAYQNNYLELTDTTDKKLHSRYVELDLGSECELNKLHLTRYADGRTYGPTAIVLSNDKDFKDKTVVFNSDKEGNVHNLGKGKDELYSETADGKTINLEKPVNARYIRIYVNGNNNKTSTSDHIVEFEAYGIKKGRTADSIYRIDFSRLEALVKEDLSKTYTKTSIKAYKEAAKDTLKAAEKLLADKDVASDEEVEKLIEEINAHREVLVKRADTTKAKELLDSVASLNKKDYTKESWNTFETARKELEKAVQDTSDVNDEQMKQLMKALEEARAKLVKVDPSNPIEPVEPQQPEDSKDETNTGDVSNMAGILTLMLVSGAGVVLLKRKSRQ
ncbi:discoidin domain-containing protein [Amedibacillus dolichus]|uniref:F5/8 type C domain protein n=1 Tax=Amedibacillus dolichus DSM 3991 TaxID=428127 RepID=A8R828_9FIRM|nr:discoidin domain-containing protein [Amedibacillus dolichus]EDP12252.1 F5/8 type C domain protein [Amedibacillus dolichus DSM 3991]